MKAENIFIVESPLQALIALELSLIKKNEKNTIIIRIKGREINDTQIRNVVDQGSWHEKVYFTYTGRLSYLINGRKLFKRLLFEFQGAQRTFFGDFNSQWMHFARFCIGAQRDYLMDDGSATIYVKKRFIDKGEFYPSKTLFNHNLLTKIYREAPFYGLVKKTNLNYSFNFASAFVTDKDGFNVDFKNIKTQLRTSSKDLAQSDQAVFYFGGKNSEDGFVPLDYEIEFLRKVIKYYDRKNQAVVYVSHRDEKIEKIRVIKTLGFSDVWILNLPAELHFLENHQTAMEFSSTYSSVLSNLRIMFPEIRVTSFKLDLCKINRRFIEETLLVYDHFSALGIPVIKI